MMKNELDELAGAYEDTSGFYRENMLTHEWYAQRIVATMRQKGHTSLISLGIGHSIVSETLLDNLTDSLQKYYIIDGSPEIIAAFQKKHQLPGQVLLINEWFEKYTPPAPVDAVEMGFVLEHVDNPLLVAKRYAGFLKPGGSLFIAVPNACSLHRRVGVEAGLLSDIYNLSEQDRGFGHKRYFDCQSLTKLVNDAGLKIVKTEGLFLKPITTSQMEALSLPPNVMSAFIKVGMNYPELSNAIYMEVTRDEP
jgi:SAM-dependent methyltransferase